MTKNFLLLLAAIGMLALNGCVSSKDVQVGGSFAEKVSEKQMLRQNSDNDQTRSAQKKEYYILKKDMESAYREQTVEDMTSIEKVNITKLIGYDIAEEMKKRGVR